MSKPLADRLRQYLTPELPLGPYDAADITDLEVAARLFDPHNKSFNTLLRRDLSVLIGRRGSGKTALLNSYSYRLHLDKYFKPPVKSAASDYRSYDIVIPIETYKEFDQMQKLVVRDANVFRPVEAIVDDWATVVMDYFFAILVDKEVSAKRPTTSLEKLQSYLHQDEDDFQRRAREIVWGVSLFQRIKQVVWNRSNEVLEHRLNREDALALAVDHLQSVGKRALMIFDSMDQYDVRSEAFNRTLAALIRFISKFNARQDQIRIKLVLPSEIYPEVSRASANPLKDLINVDQLSWSPTELQQIAAHRYRLFLELYDNDFAIELSELDLNKSNIVRLFWSRFLPETHQNGYGTAEDPMIYVLRHTQLLPRQFLLILKEVIIRSHHATGGYRKFEPKAIAGAIDDAESTIAREILSAFSHIYPIAEELCAPVFANFPTVFSFEELEDKWRRKGRPVAQALAPEFDTPQFAEMLVRMGIVGIGHDETDRYYEGEFAYDSLHPTNIGEGHALCLHPIFSKQFNAAGNVKRKAVIPKRVVRRAQEDDN